MANALRTYYGLPAPSPRPWPDQLRNVLGEEGLEALRSLLVIEPTQRPTAPDAAERWGRLEQLPTHIEMAAGCWSRFSINAGECQPEVLRWLQKDRLFTDPEYANSLQLSWENMPRTPREAERQARQLDARKTIVMGCRTPGEGSVLFKKSAAELLPCLRSAAWMNALLLRHICAVEDLDVMLRSHLSRLTSHFPIRLAGVLRLRGGL